ncbi:hypothetical protein ACHAXN_005883 [Cyclotella atomus]|jgi:hypothetical protein
MQQSTQPNYIPANQDEENYNPNLNSSSQAKQRSAGRTHFNVYLNTPQQQAPHEQHQYASSPPLQQFAPPHPNMWFSPPPVYVQAPPPPPLYTYPPPYGMQPLPQQQPTVIFMQQPPSEQKKKEEPPKKEIKEKKKEEPKPPPPPPAPVAPPPPPPPPKPDEMLDICIASIIIFCIGFMLGICSVVRSNDAYEAHIDYEEEGSTNKSGTLYETWQMARNTALGTGAAAVVCFSLAFLLVFWSGINHKMYRGVQPGFCMAGCLISGWIVFALTFLVDVVVLVLAFDSDNVVYPEVVWAAFVGNVVAWLLMLTHSELARRVE